MVKVFCRGPQGKEQPRSTKLYSKRASAMHFCTNRLLDAFLTVITFAE